ncbi:SseB family protein [Micromonospora mangrovi]|uniref:SseB family protein n=2 Tax=Micromonospora TaxID=1873 RepID=A0AAU8HC34_9ACTN
MTEWEPATEAEAEMQDALRAQNQELYFRILTRTELLLPVSAEALAGRAPMGWGTWTTGGRTHVLAFTSAAAMRACLGEHAGTSRRAAYADLAADWPNHEWWLAVNPGLPIEGYLPAWFVAQLSRGDVRLPGRTMGARARLERAENAARARADAAGQDAPVSPAPQPVPAAPRRPATTPPEPSTVPIPTVPAAPVPAAAPTPPPVPAPAVPPPVVPAPVVPPPVVPAPSVPAAAVPAPPVRTPAGPSPVPGGAAGQPTSNGAPAGAMPPPARVPLRRATEEGGHPPDAAGARPGRPTPPPRSPLRAEQGGESVSGWLDDLRGRPDEPDPFGAGTAARPGGEPANGRSGEPSGRSFFEPASGRSRRMSPLDKPRRAGDRAVPPSRLGQGGQAFPRRRPLSEPVRDEPTRAFRFDAPEEADRTTPRPEAPGGEPTVAFPAATPTDETTQALPRRRPPSAEPAEQTVPIPPAPAYDPVDEPEELPTSIAEPVSGPPASRRGFSPIVIEGTVIESRDLDLAGPVSPAAATPWAGPTPASVVADPPVAPSPGTSAAAAADPVPPVDTEPPAAGRADAEMPVADRAGAVDAESSAAGWAGAEVPVADRAGADDAMPAATGVAPSFPADDSTLPLDVPAEQLRPDTVEPVDEPVTEAVPVGPATVDFLPANEVEEDLLGAAGSGSTDTFLSTLLLARVLLPVAPDSLPGSRPGEPGFVWHTEELDGETYVVVYTSPERLADRTDGAVDTVLVRFVQLIRRWPDENWSFAVNPGTPVGAKYPGEQVVGLANWAAEVGLGDDAESEPEQPAAEPVSRPRPAPPAVDPTRPVTMQKAVAPSQLAYYLERGYDRVSGFVHRANELAHLNSPAQLYDALGLGHPDSPFTRDAAEIYVLRWPAHRPSLYRIPYGGQSEAAMRAMEGWVIERPPFRGNGFAPGESSDVVAEFKVDSARLPHGAQLWRIGSDGSERVIAILDTDALLWRQVGAP